MGRSCLWPISAVAMPDDLFSFNNFALSSQLSLCLVDNSFNTMGLDWQLFTFFPDPAIPNF